jgi:Holliday junction DNA helicase RuvA
MITRLTGSIHRLSPTEALVDVHGVGYKVSVPVDTWDTLPGESEGTLWTSTYVREDRLDLYGFRDRNTLMLFEELIAQQGIGPKVGLELCAMPRELLSRAVSENDAALLCTVKGIGKKRAEKLLLELRSLAEKSPNLLAADGVKTGDKFDHDAVAALAALGYDTPTILTVLQKLPKSLETTEERVTAALRSL